MGRIFDERGNRMTPSHAVKNGMRYRYYISSVLIQGQPDKAAKLNRVPAPEIEKLILSAARKHLAGKPTTKVGAEGPHSLNDKELISAYVARVDVKPDHLAIQLHAKSEPNGEAQACWQSVEQDERVHRDPHVLVVPWKKTSVKTTAGDYSPRVDILSSRPPSNPRRNPRQAPHRDRKGAALAR